MNFHNVFSTISKAIDKLSNLTNLAYKVTSDFDESRAKLKTLLNNEDYVILDNQLKNISFDDLKKLMNKYSEDYHVFINLNDIISKKNNIEWISNSIEVLKRIIKNLIRQLKFSIKNKREFIRKIFSFNFKNLDDTHATVIFN